MDLTRPESDQVLAYDEGREVVAGASLPLVGHDLEVHAARDGVEETGGRAADGHVELPRGEGGHHLGPRGERLDLHRDAARLEVALVDRDVETDIGNGRQLAHPDDLGRSRRPGEHDDGGEGDGHADCLQTRANGHDLSPVGVGDAARARVSSKKTRKSSAGGREDSSARAGDQSLGMTSRAKISRPGISS